MFTVSLFPDLNPEQREIVRQLWNEEYPAGLNLATSADFDNYLNGLTQKTHYLLLTGTNEIAGWGLTFQRDNEQWFAMIVHRAYQGKQAGTQLLRNMQNNNPVLYGWVIDHSNDSKSDGTNYPSPLPFYLKNGFVTDPGIRLELPHLSAVRICWSRS